MVCDVDVSSSVIVLSTINVIMICPLSLSNIIAHLQSFMCQLLVLGDLVD